MIQLDSDGNYVLQRAKKIAPGVAVAAAFRCSPLPASVPAPQFLAVNTFSTASQRVSWSEWVAESVADSFCIGLGCATSNKSRHLWKKVATVISWAPRLSLGPQIASKRSREVLRRRRSFARCRADQLGHVQPGIPRIFKNLFGKEKSVHRCASMRIKNNGMTDKVVQKSDKRVKKFLWPEVRPTMGIVLSEI